MSENIHIVSLYEGDTCPHTGIWTVGENPHFVSKEVFETQLCAVINEGDLAPKVPFNFPYWVFHKDL